MGTVLASVVIGKAQAVLQDIAGTRWPVESEMLGWLNDGQREFVIIKPTISTVLLTMKMVAGTAQVLPAGYAQFLDMICNMGTDGNTPGRATRLVDRETLDAQLPTWHASTPSATIKHFVFDVRMPKAFMVYPPQPGADQGYARMSVVKEPDNVVASSNPISIDDIYQGALVDYILYRCFSKDSELSDAARAQSFKNSYITTLTGKAKVEAGYDPNKVSPANTQSPTA